MEHKFVIYDIISSKEDIKNINWNNICQIINKLSTEQGEIIYGLILHYYLLELYKKNNDINIVKNQLKKMCSNRKLHTIYNSKSFTNGRGIIFTLDNLPLPLQQIIAKYVMTICH